MVERRYRVAGAGQEVNLFLVNDDFGNDAHPVQLEAGNHRELGFRVFLERVLVAFFFVRRRQLNLEHRNRVVEDFIAQANTDAGLRIFNQEAAEHVLPFLCHV